MPITISLVGMQTVHYFLTAKLRDPYQRGWQTACLYPLYGNRMSLRRENSQSVIERSLLATSWKTSYIPYSCSESILHVCNKPINGYHMRITIHRHVSFAPTTFIRVPQQDTNNIQCTAYNHTGIHNINNIQKVTYKYKRY
jgi:hypothetical protein